MNLYRIEGIPIEAAENFNSDQAKVHAWASGWLVTLTHQKQNL